MSERCFLPRTFLLKRQGLKNVQTSNLQERLKGPLLLLFLDEHVSCVIGGSQGASDSEVQDVAKHSKTCSKKQYATPLRALYGWMAGMDGISFLPNLIVLPVG